MAKPFFSVIIPAYNRRDLLKISLESVLFQARGDFEVIVVDDGSTDGTGKLVSGYNDKRIKYLYQENHGVSCARNLGLTAAAGEWICFLDSDDRFRRDKLEVTGKFIALYQDYKIFHTEELWYSNGSLISQKKYHKKPHGFIFEYAVKMCSIGISTSVLHKSVFENVGKFDENMPACEDYDFWLRASLLYPMFLIPIALTIKQGGHPGQQSKIYPCMDKFRIYSLQKILKNPCLDEAGRLLASRELQRKCRIYIQGCRKRGKNEEADRIIAGSGVQL